MPAMRVPPVSSLPIEQLATEPEPAVRTLLYPKAAWEISSNPMWAPAANLDGLDAAYTSCPRPSSCGAWNGSARLSRDAGGEQLGPVPLIQLIGTRKGGTTALSAHMLAHPHLLAPDCSTHKRKWPRVAQTRMCVWDKEVRYFSRGFRGPGAKQAQPLGSVDLCWYRSLYPCVPAGAPHVGFDGSPDYAWLDVERAKLKPTLKPTPHNPDRRHHRTTSKCRLDPGRSPGDEKGQGRRTQCN